MWPIDPLAAWLLLLLPLGAIAILSGVSAYCAYLNSADKR